MFLKLYLRCGPYSEFHSILQNKDQLCYLWIPVHHGCIFQVQAVENEIGLATNPLTVSWLSGKPAPAAKPVDQVDSSSRVVFPASTWDISSSASSSAQVITSNFIVNCTLSSDPDQEIVDVVDLLFQLSHSMIFKTGLDQIIKADMYVAIMHFAVSLWRCYE